MMNLPFLKPKGWPMKAEVLGEKKYGYSEDDELIDNALDELLACVEAKDHKGLVHALKALIELYQAKEDHATDTL
jgi:hypothetical protein